MVEIRVKDDSVIAFANDWKSLSQDEKSFFSRCYIHAIWTAFDADGNLVMQPTESASKKVRLINQVKTLAKSLNIRVSAEIEDLLDGLQETAKKDEERFQTAREIEMRRLRWENRKKGGCANCKYCEQKGDSWFVCNYSGDVLDTRFSEQWDGLNGVYEVFHEDGEPNEHCKDFYREEIVKRTEEVNGKI